LGNKEFAGENCSFDDALDYNHKILLFDAQTSGGLLMCVDKTNADQIIFDLKENGYPHSAIVGKVTDFDKKYVHVK